MDEKENLDFQQALRLGENTAVVTSEKNLNTILLKTKTILQILNRLKLKSLK